jgi:acetyl-CoA C-acetyltransferase
MMTTEPIAIVAARRTPIGSFQGALSRISAVELGAAAIQAAVGDSGLDGSLVDEVLMGCVLPAGLGQAPARQAALAAGLPDQVGAVTINKVCGSGMRAVMFGCDMIHSGSAKVVVAGGMESMSNAPYLLPKARGGYRLGHGQLLDHMYHDGLQNPADGHLMGEFAERLAEEGHYSRAEQDAFAMDSVTKAQQAQKGGMLAGEIIAVPGTSGEPIILDEGPQRIKPEKIPTLKPVFRADGTVTAASSSSIADGAAAMVLMSASEARNRDVPVLGWIMGQSVFAREPEWFTLAPIGAVNRLLEQLTWARQAVDLWEINEAFAVVAMAAVRELGLDASYVNVHGGACALGHPIGATGARILVTLLHAMQERSVSKGVATLCIGGGEATAMAVTRQP